MLKQTLSRNSIFSFSIIITSLIISFFIVFIQTGAQVNAQSRTPNISFPISELGNCQNEDACKIYCDQPNHIEACVSFAEKNNLMSADEAARARNFVKVTKEGSGPGGCKSREECENYCNNMANMEICVQFARNHGLMNKEEMDQAEKMEIVLKNGIQTPGSCHTKKECESYCSNSAHVDECLSFAQKAGLIKEDEVNRAKQMMNLMAQGKTPGGCDSREKCENYCFNNVHMDECAKFAVDNGMMDQQQAEIMKKTGGVGPGGCRGEECESFCNNPANQQICFKFAQDHNLISQDQIQNIREGINNLRQNMNNMPPEVIQCLKDTAGQNILDGIQSGRLMPGPEIGNQIKNCFEKLNKGKPQDKFQSEPQEKFQRESQEKFQREFQNNNNQGFPDNSSSAQSWQGQQGQRDKSQFCPKMPTVVSCPANQEKFLIFKSLECGEYYGCRSSMATSTIDQINMPQIQQIPPQYLPSSTSPQPYPLLQPARPPQFPQLPQ